MFGFKVQKETDVEVAEKRLTHILDMAVNYRSRKIVRRMDTMDLVEMYERQSGSVEPISNLVQIVVINELRDRYPRAIRTWLEHTKLHLRQVIETEMRLREKEALSHERKSVRQPAPEPIKRADAEEIGEAAMFGGDMSFPEPPTVTEPTGDTSEQE